MTPVERRFAKGWLLTALGAAIATWFNGCLAVLMFFVLPIPFVILIFQAPGIILYFTATALIYIPLRMAFGKSRKRRLVIAGTSLSLVVGASWLVARLANDHIEAATARLLANDHGGPPQISPVDTIGIARNSFRDFNEKCSDECQRLLFSGLAKSVIQGDLDMLAGDGLNKARTIRHSIVQIEKGCDNGLLTPSYAVGAEWSGGLPPPRLWEKLEVLEEEGLCFRSDVQHGGMADIYLVDETKFSDHPSERFPYRLTLSPFDQFKRQRVLIRSGNELVTVMQRTSFNVSKIGQPLWLVAPFSFDIFTPGHWMYAGWSQLGTKLPSDQMMGHWIRNDVRIKGLGHGREIVVTGRKDQK